jgi:hypothetical protein
VLNGHRADNFLDERVDGQDQVRPHYRRFQQLFSDLNPEDFDRYRQSVDLAFLRQGITFNVYGDAQGTEKIFPFDLIPRIISAKEWERLEAGLVQRITALNPTGTNGEGVAGVRYRPWQPPECLQPTIGVHTPLTFDHYDTWNGRSLGGCQYHVAHPGGRSYDTFPVNSYEAESRRLARFFTHGASEGKFNPPAPSENGDFPFTLDLRATL